MLQNQTYYAEIVTGHVKTNHVSANYTYLCFNEYLQF